MKYLKWKLLFLIVSVLPITVSASVEANVAHINKMASKYKVSAVQLRTTLRCESGYRQYNSKGEILRGTSGEYGIAQYMPGTWKWMEGMFLKKYGRDLSMYDTEDQIEMTAFAFSKGLQNHWVCYKLAYARHLLPPSFLATL